MDVTSATLLGIIVALSTILGKVVEMVISSFFDRRRDGGEKEKGHELNTFRQQVKQQIDRLTEWHDVRDQNGVPVWYFPRLELIRQMEDMSRNIEELNRTVDEIHSLLQDVLRERNRR